MPEADSAQRSEHLRWLGDNERNFLNRYNMKKNKTEQRKGKLTPNAVLNEVGGAVVSEKVKCTYCKWEGREDQLKADYYDEYNMSMAIASQCPKCGSDVE